MNTRQKVFTILYTQSFIYRDDPPFTLVSGATSPYYFDCKATTLDPGGVALVGEALYDLLEETIVDQSVQALGGLTLGADPISVSTAIAAWHRGKELSPLVVRKEAKKHGTARWIEGRLDGVKKVIAVDDVITTGGSTVTAIERLREGGLEVVAAAVLVDRQEGGRESIEKTGVPVLSLFKREEFDARRMAEGE